MVEIRAFGGVFKMVFDAPQVRSGKGNCVTTRLDKSVLNISVNQRGKARSGGAGVKLNVGSHGVQKLQ